MMNYFGFLGSDEEQVLTKITPILDEVLEAHSKENYVLFAGHLSQKRAKNVTEKPFLDAARATNKRLGRCKEKRFLAALRRDGRPMLLWVAKFSKSENDVLISLIVKQQDDKPVVDWFWIE